ncbi:Phage head-tail joining protein [Planctomycetes bacterium Pan216]|uniref:Phage head-tail joining protein n=1 Tax=Kolteria novifilia TaxID=2527975 RepID=A0A518B5B3_9BACT|nr:Phage head-tail joining protein [Planctomycetes bacterium Pan216]
MSKNVKAGELRHKATFERKTETLDDYGEPVTTWEFLADRRAKLTAIAGNEYWLASQTKSKATHRIECRHLPGLKTADRVRIGSRTFEIESAFDPTNIGRRSLILATEEL